VEVDHQGTGPGEGGITTFTEVFMPETVQPVPMADSGLSFTISVFTVL
jgi:hypothetical protein